MPLALLKADDGAAHPLINGKTVVKRFFATLNAFRPGGRIGMLTSRARSIERETLASTKAMGPRARRSADSAVILFANGAVELLLLPQFCAMLLDSFASRRGRFIVAVTSAFNWLRNWKPIGIEGLNARPSRSSALVTLTLMGSGVSAVS